MIGDNVEEDLHPCPVRLVHQLRQLGVDSEVGVDLGEICNPVPVIAGATVLRLDRAVLEAWCQPDRGRAQSLDVVEAVDYSPKVATVIEATSGRIKARDHRVIRQPGEIISSRAVFKAVRHHEVKNFVSYRRPQTVSTASQARARTSSSVVKSVILFGHFIASGRGARVRCGHRRILGIC